MFKFFNNDVDYQRIWIYIIERNTYRMLTIAYVDESF